MLTDLSKTNSLINQYISELRDVNIQSDRLRFRRNINRIGNIIAYEISKKIPFISKEVVTPLGICKMSVLKEHPVVATILRAGIPLHSGILDFFDQADNCFLASYRKHHSDGTFEIAGEYVACPDLTDRILILADPMLATGRSIISALKNIEPFGKPSVIHIVSVIAAEEGVKYVHKHRPDVNIWLAALDNDLTKEFYIMPGLGDAGDLCFGEKVQR